jgi:hypothetical protein
MTLDFFLAKSHYSCRDKSAPAKKFIPLHMDVFRFAVIEGLKEEARKSWDIFHAWHLFPRSRQRGSLFRWVKKPARSLGFRAK